MASPKTYCIAGVKVLFPCQPYPSQMAMMNSIIRALEKKQNCLVESPTGSGKSLAILCSALAWQQKEREKLVSSIFDASAAVGQSLHKDNINQVISLRHFRDEIKSTEKTDLSVSKSHINENSDFKPMKKYRGTTNKGVEFFDLPKENFSEGGEQTYCLASSNLEQNAIAFPHLTLPSREHFGDTEKIKPPPKIFIGTRTHKQVTQLVHELRKTPYQTVRMCILSSRDRTCIHPDVSSQSDKNEGCRQLLTLPNGPHCSYYRNTLNEKFGGHFSETAWDIEDVVTFGRKVRLCPYFYLRDLVKNSDIIFCPYNYLIDSEIRTAMNISLQNHVVILDEAHNIEDSARSASSFSVTMQQLTCAMRNLEDIKRIVPKKTGSCLALEEFLSALADWITRNSENLSDYSQFEKSVKVLSGEELVSIFHHCGAGPNETSALRLCFEDLMDDPTSKDKETAGLLLPITVILFKGIFMVLGYLYCGGMKFMPDYKGALEKSISQSDRSTPKRWMNKTQIVSSYTYTLNFWCMNPAVALSDFKNEIHSLIVTSGTLSPLASLPSELNTAFDLKLEANHVVKRSQIWVGTVGLGPTGHPLNAVFRNTETFTFQDEVGKVILNVCSVVAHGVLCFFPSYAALDKLSNRWRVTGLWSELLSQKAIVCEPRRLDAQNLESVMKEFYDAIEEGRGALFLAVCRGKVSEGLDFADNNARAVITVGIPFPNVKDVQVNLKKEYNNKYRAERGIMSGNDWYEAQAFRALNQALGRCIRHKADWGALILMDERFQKTVRYVASLSKWIRNEVTHYSDFRTAMDSLQDFVSNKSGHFQLNGSVTTCNTPQSQADFTHFTTSTGNFGVNFHS